MGRVPVGHGATHQPGTGTNVSRVASGSLQSAPTKQESHVNAPVGPTTAYSVGLHFLTVHRQKAGSPGRLLLRSLARS